MGDAILDDEINIGKLLSIVNTEDYMDNMRMNHQCE